MPEAVILAAIADELLLRTVSWFLKEHGYDVLEASDSAGIFEYLDSTVPDLLLLDVTADTMPDPGALERIKADVPWRDMPVLLLATLPPDDNTIRLLSLGATDFIGKPFRVRELLARIQVQLRIHQMLVEARTELRTAEEELHRARSQAESQKKLVGILNEVSGDFTPDEIYHLVVRRAARALNITHCSLILGQADDEQALVSSAFENPALRNLEIKLVRYPEIRAALERGGPVLIADIDADPMFQGVRSEWASEGMDPGIRSVLAIPFQLDRIQSGVFLLRTLKNEPPLTPEHAEFADAIIRTATGAIRKAKTLEITKADKMRLEELASTDSLTSLLNRRALMERLEAELDRARRYEHGLVLLMIDLDHFKSINDGHGHPFGDLVLQDLARLLEHEVRSVDIVARYGGEEFVVVLPEQGKEGALVFAERVRTHVEGHSISTGGGNGNGKISLTVSIGLSEFPLNGIQTPGELIARADEALYRAKAAGRNHVSL
ncbi:MAG: diguanylate cyclase [Anaerolineae bacterium]|nr:diguanylate cyclase [Gemmatimonadaceae bacterium]